AGTTGRRQVLAPQLREVAPALVAWRADGQRCALATVVRVYGRAPLPVGASLAVCEDGATAGAVSGGCVEQEVLRTARDVMAGGPPRRLTFAPDDDGVLGLGLPCGGGIDVWVQPWDADLRRADHGAFTAAVLADERAQFCTALEDTGEVLELVVEPRGRLVLVGAGLVAGALCAIAPGLGWTPIIVDPREVIAAHAPTHDAARLLLTWPDEAVAGLGPLGPDDAVVVLSHQPALDDAALRVALTTGAGFIGALGSRRAHADRLARLRDHGLGDADLARVVGPVGLDLGGWSPDEIALSIAAELVAVRHGRAGGRLVDATGPIHGAARAAARAPEPASAARVADPERAWT
ncbi:MAG: XdhC family protein, partial [Solirubrobacteraceae bacterium]